MEKQRLPSTITLFILVSIASIAAVLYTPALPQFKTFFNIDSDRVQWTVNLFLFGYAIGQLIYAPFSNRFKRRNTLFLGLSLSCLGAGICILSYFSQEYFVLLLGLLVMSLGSSAGLSLAFTIINDVYDHQLARKVIPMVTLAFSVMPGLGVFLGGFLVDNLHWSSCFVFLLGYFLFVGILVYLLPETCKRTDPNALNLANIFGSYKAVITSRTLWHYSLIWGFCTAIVYIFATTAPLIVITHMKVNPSVYGTFNLLTSVGFISGTLFTRSMVSRLTPLQMMTVGLFIALIGSVLLVGLSWLTKLGPWGVFLSMFFIFLGLPPIFSTASSLAVRDLPDKASASSLMTFINMAVTVVLLFSVGLIPGDPEQVMAEVFLLILLVMGSFILSSRSIETKPPSIV